MIGNSTSELPRNWGGNAFFTLFLYLLLYLRWPASLRPPHSCLALVSIQTCASATQHQLKQEVQN